ncbi:MAG: P-II family nitrogen regulator [Candidatus Binatia bacterium]
MKEIKAYVRINMLDKVIHGLEAAGFTDMTVLDVRALRRGVPDVDLEYSVELVARYMNVAKLEIVVRDQDVAVATRIICEHARTGTKGDGLVYVSAVEQAIHIRSGASGEAAVEYLEG